MNQAAHGSPANRRYDFDWLRVFGAVMVVVGHCSMIFAPWARGQSNVPGFGNLASSQLLAELAWNLNLWLMPLFMLLAGASTWFALRKRTNRQYLGERLLHLGLPFASLMLVFVVPLTYFVRTSTGQFNGSLAEFYFHFFDGIYPDGNFNLFHLWFLLYLLVYVLLTLPLFRFLQSGRGARLTDRLAGICLRPGGPYVFALPLAVVQVALTAISPPGPAGVIVNDWAHFMALLLTFVYGYILLCDARFQQAIQEQWRAAGVITLGLSAVMFVIAWPESFNPYRDLPLDYSWRYWTFWTGYALCSWSWMLVWLGLGQRFLNVSHPLLKSASEASFPLYLFHLPVWIPGVFLLSGWQVGAIPAFLVLTVCVLTGTLGLIVGIKQWRRVLVWTRFRRVSTHVNPSLTAARSSRAGLPGGTFPRSASNQSNRGKIRIRPLRSYGE